MTGVSNHNVHKVQHSSFYLQSLTMNTHWSLYRFTTFWESHGAWLGVVIDGYPAGIELDLDLIRRDLIRRKPGQSKITTARKEDDEMFEIISGVFEGKSTGHPITFLVRNKQQKSKDYSNLKDLYRPNHADLTYHKKYGIRDHRWWWRSSGRETLSRVIAWALAKQYLKMHFDLDIFAFVKQVGDIRISKIEYASIESSIIRTADPDVADAMIEHIQSVAQQGDSIWGIIECHSLRVPVGLGEPVFDKLKARLAWSMLSLWWVLWFEYGAWFETTKITWKSYNEWYISNAWSISSNNNNYGGIQWGISTWEPVIFRIAVKPTSSIYTKQSTVTTSWEAVDFQISGRHDPCILPRVVPVVEAMVACDLLDFVMMQKARKH